MADSEAFDFVCDQLERETSLERLEARGTVRIALKEAGLEARTVSPAEMAVVVQKLLPKELSSRGIDDGEAVLGRIGRALASLTPSAKIETPESVFQRLGGTA